jgi:Bacteriophage Mu Gp45 spike protein
MHRATPANSSFRAYSSGGARSVVDKVDDKKLMQEMGGNFMHSETRTEIESPQNYGFTSVVHDAEKDAQGKITDGAETFISFIGGNRSFPVAGAMDDRRHRLHDLEKGDTAMFRGKDDQQQLHMNKDGGHWSAPEGKTVRMALVPKKQQQQQQQQGVQAQQLADEQGQQGQQQNQQKQRGQKPVLDDNKKSKKFIDVTDDAARVSGKNAHLMLDDGKVYVHVADDKKVYLGAKRGEAAFSLVVTLAGPSVNVLAKIG